MDFTWESALVPGWDGWLEAWIGSCLLVAGMPLLVALLLVAVVAVAEPRVLRRHFWCALRRRDVEVEFATHGVLPRPCGVVSCSAFEPADAVGCRRRCLDPAFRHQWPAPLAELEETR
jgi:hypothetical protein